MRTTNLRNQFARLFLLACTLTLTAFLINACKGGSANSVSTSGGGGGSPTEAYKNLFAAVKSKNTADIKKQMSKASLQFAEMAAGQQNKSVDQVLENGFLASTQSPSLPPIRDERVSGNMGAIEVWDSKNSRWEDDPFVLEDGAWKLAVGNMFQGSWKSPGKGQSAREMEAANAAGNNMIPAVPNSNVNFNAIKPIKPKELPQANAKK